MAEKVFRLRNRTSRAGSKIDSIPSVDTWGKRGGVGPGLGPSEGAGRGRVGRENLGGEGSQKGRCYRVREGKHRVRNVKLTSRHKTKKGKEGGGKENVFFSALPKPLAFRRGGGRQRRTRRTLKNARNRGVSNAKRLLTGPRQNRKTQKGNQRVRSDRNRRREKI